ncbi:MAG: peptidase M24 [Acidiferrobacteraceae bacterium]|nr:peptidase M24 [Acidiferrobacteraceae bacterium]|tara:strand:+ start:25839 stop:27047 length:1209 start_codon:yes stop_codon:yes gene_type:complete
MYSSIIPMEDRHKIYRARQNRLREIMLLQQIPTLLVTDPIHIRYATGARNMQIWSSRESSRFLLLLAEGPTFLFEYPGYEHLAAGLPTLDQIFTGQAIPYAGPGIDPLPDARKWGSLISELIYKHSGRGSLIAVDRLPYPAIDVLRANGFLLTSADVIMGISRSIKMSEEIPAIRLSMDAVEEAVLKMENLIKPGMTENQIWANFHHGLIERDAEYVTTRLLVGGERSYPYFRECGEYFVTEGNLITFDTDAIGVDGYSVDFSRTFLCGNSPAKLWQKQLYRLAYDQLQHNVGLFINGTSFEEIVRKAWPVPEQYQSTSYYVIAHGIGMSGEYPAIPHSFNPNARIPQGNLNPGMTLCVESYIGSSDHQQGVKLEEHILITENTPEILSKYNYDERLLVQYH